MEYEELLQTAYESIKPCEECGRFDLKKVAGDIEGNKTIISNFGQIVACLRRSQDHVLKFLLKELATSGSVENDRLILTRKISSNLINEKIQKYANTYVICPACKKPDTELVDENGQKFIRCMACGARKPVSNKI